MKYRIEEDANNIKAYNGTSEVSSINKTTLKFLGATKCITQLLEYIEEKKSNMEEKLVSRIDVIEALKKKFPSNNTSSWTRNSNTELLAWYREYILEDVMVKVKFS